MRLEENPTTGYSWELSLSPGLKIISDRYIAPTVDNRIGAGGIHEWKIQAKRTGSQTIYGVYRRSWEPLTGDETSYYTRITVVPENLIGL